MKVAMALARIATLPSSFEGEKKRYVAEQLFALEALSTDKPIRPENPHVSVMLRQAQFEVSVERRSWDRAEAVASRLMEEVELIPKDQMRDETKAIAISAILSEPSLPRSLPRWFDYLVELTQLISSGKGPQGEEIRNRAEDFRREAGFTIPQFMFSLGATKPSSISDLEKLFSRLDGIPASLRDEFLTAFFHGPLNLNLMVASAWLGDHERGEIDGHSASQRYESLARLADRWAATTLAIECEVARSVMLDEYALDPLAALAALDDAEKRYGPRLELARQRAKVLYRKGDHAASLDVVRAIGDQLDPKDRVERAFAFRSAGISAAELGD